MEDPQRFATLLGVASFHRATCYRRNLSTIQAARREIAPHRAALIASLDKRCACLAFNLASFSPTPSAHEGGLGEEAPFALFRADLWYK